MPRPKPAGPTERELELLQILWRSGPSSVRGVRDALNREKNRGEGGRGVAYNSVLTVMSIMQTKSLVSRDTSGRTHIYRAAVTQAETEARLVGRLIDEVFGGSATRLVSRALAARTPAEADAAEIERLLAALGDADGDAHG